jgi:hypothetical protein
MLLWPFSDQRFAWHLISVVDPLFTLPLIICVVIGLRRQRAVPVIAGLAWCLVGSSAVSRLSTVTMRVTLWPLAAKRAVYPTSGALVKPAVAAAPEGVLSAAWKLTQAMLAAGSELAEMARVNRRGVSFFFMGYVVTSWATGIDRTQSATNRQYQRLTK